MHTTETIKKKYGARVVIHFVTFPLIWPNMNGTSDKEGKEPRLLPLWCCYFKSVTKGCARLRSWKNAIFKLNLQNLMHTFWQHFTKNPFFFYDEILAIIRALPPSFFFFNLVHSFCQHFTENLLFISNKKYLLFSYLFFPPFLFWCLCQSYKNFWLLKRKMGWGSPPKKLKKCNAHIQFAKFGVYLLATFY